MLVIIFLSSIQVMVIIFLINKIYILEKKNQYLQEEKNSTRKLVEFDKSINW
jgi:ABC-type bacteriocin/lantibiotic exporter with double-glycine peptidase domain